MNIDINRLAVLVATLASTVLAIAYFHQKMFGATWAQLVYAV